MDDHVKKFQQLHNNHFYLDQEVTKQKEEISCLRTDLQIHGEEISCLRNYIQIQKEELINVQVTLTRLTNVLNEKITDLYGDINHIKKYESKAKEVQREKIIMHNYFTDSKIKKRYA